MGGGIEVHLEGARCRVVGRRDPGRAALEGYVAQRYREAFGAELGAFMPTYVAFESAGHTLAAVGVRPASAEPLFLEQYLDDPVEIAVSAAVGRIVPRAGIVEVGNFAASSAGAMRAIIEPLGHSLRRAGYACAAFVATRPLRNAFARIGLAPQELGPATPDRLDSAAAWGRYFEHAPIVVCGDLSRLPAEPAGLALPICAGARA